LHFLYLLGLPCWIEQPFPWIRDRIELFIKERSVPSQTNLVMYSVAQFVSIKSMSYNNSLNHSFANS
jgi:hypothetical protein